MNDIKKIDSIISAFEKNKKIIIKKTKAFEEIFSLGKPKDIFYELVYCILAAGTSAELALKTVKIITEKDLLIYATEAEIIKELKKCYRFYNVRGKYIYNVREYINLNYSFDIRKLINQFDNSVIARNELAQNKEIKGIGMKASSHFLRNIGFKNLAILDIHILSLMKEMSLIPKNFKLTIKNYEKTEDILRKLSHQINIDLPELDLTLWFMKTNKIIK